MRYTFEQVRSALEELDIAFDVSGDSSSVPYGFASLRGPDRSGIFFVEDAAFDPGRIESGIVLARQPVESTGITSVVVSHPQVVFYRLMRHLLPDDAPGQVHPTAVVDVEAFVHPSAVIGPYCVIGKARIGAGVRLGPHVVVFDNCEIEDDAVVDAHAGIGVTGTAWAWDPDTGERVRQPQTGGARVGARCFLGSHVGIVRGSVNELTEIGRDTLIAPGTKIGHGCRVGASGHMANNVTVGGNVDLGDRVFLGSGSVVRSRVSIANDVVIAAGAVVVGDVVKPGSLWMGVPAREAARKGDLTGVPKPFEGGRK